MPPHRAIQNPSSAADPHADVAWHLLTVLLRLRRPAHPSELAALSAISFGPLSPNLVTFLSRIPGSPLHLRQDGLLTVSAGATAALLAFAFAEFPRFARRPVDDVPGWTEGWDLSGLLFRGGTRRKRKGGSLSATPKRRLTVPEPEDHPDENASVQLASVSGRGALGRLADEGIIFNIGIAHATESKLLNDESQLENELVILNNDSATIALLDRDASPRSDARNGIKFDKEDCDVEMRSSQQGYEAPNLPEQQLQQCDPHGAVINRNAADLEELVAREPWISMIEAVLGVSTAKLDEFVPSVCQGNEMVVQENLSEFSLEAQGRRNNENVAAGICCHAAEAGVFFDSEKGIATHKLGDKDTFCTGGTLLDVNVDVPQGSIHPVDGTLSEMHVGQRFAKREATSSSLALKKSIIKDDCFASATKTRGCTSSLDCNVDGNEGAQIEIRKKYVRRKFRSQNQDRQEKVAESAPAVTKVQVGAKQFPQFDSFLVEDAEGSGGYGTVYRARRKDDGKTFALKCPHSNAHSFHINNELKMLERFGGRSFIIRLEGSFKSGKSECFVLEHVEHDRPEVLKREIEVSELQWYCYCLFKALSSLHKQGVVHRDVKPGNFLFSRKVSKGYLIDFNLALDLHHKHRLNNRYDPDSKGGPVESSPLKVAPLTSSRKALNSQYPEAVRNERNKEPRRSTLSNNNRKGLEKGHLDVFSDFSGRQKNKKQVAADGSGLTSVKDASSNRTPSAERMREPIPCRGRKELLNLVQEVMHSPKRKSSPPISQRKRIPAPLGKVERLLALLTPMPLQLNGSPVLTGHLKNKGSKEKMEGPCVGTKGFRAPEVLFRSRHQGFKVDVWSAGVTILYMIIGRMPFSGDPEQNIKEIAKLKGSEDLWEVAKIHDRELSFPTELFDIQCLQSVKLRDWCKKNTKKPEFLDKVPDTVFDLVDRCLTVNPRLRISSEEVLMHGFLSPCREELRKQRMLRLSHDPQLEFHTKL